ncbi:unnamed protein product [Calypogeia fissa]
MDTVNQKPVVVLIVGNDRTDKDGVADSLTRDETWKRRTTPAGAEIFEGESLSRVTVVDTRPLKYKKNRSETDTSRQWLSRNCVRRLVAGKDVVVVCVLPCTVGNTGKDVSPRFHGHRQKWMKVFKLIFGPLITAVTVLAKTVGDNLAGGDTSDLEEFVEHYNISRENIIYSHVQNSICLSSILSNAKPMPGNLQTNVIWAPERVLLLGLTGSGKSTLAQMLTSGEINPADKKFVTGSGARGVTKKLVPGEGRGWFVVDTPGFGEDKTGTVDQETVRKRVIENVKLVEGTFSHYLFVTREGRQDYDSRRIWNFVTEFFGDEIIRHFSVVVSEVGDDWIDEQREELGEAFPGCKNFFSANFPDVSHVSEEDINSLSPDDRKEWDKLINSHRVLEENLANLALVEVETRVGKSSTRSLQFVRDRACMDLSLKKHKLAQIADPIFTFIGVACNSFVRLTSLLARFGFDYDTPLPRTTLTDMYSSIKRGSPHRVDIE